MKRLFDLHLAFLITQMSFYRKKLPIYRRKEPSSRTILFNSFILTNLLIFHNFLFKWFYHIFRISVLYCMRHNSLHAVKLNKYSHSAFRRRFSWNTWLQIKTFTSQNFYFFMFSVDLMSSVFLKIYIYVNKTKWLIFDIFLLSLIC